MEARLAEIMDKYEDRVVSSFLSNEVYDDIKYLVKKVESFEETFAWLQTLSKREDIIKIRELESEIEGLKQQLSNKQANHSQVTNNSYWCKDVADLLQIGESTLRKWCLSLEDKGYVFKRGQHKSRVFLDHGILVLRKMKELIQEKCLVLKTASEVVTSIFEIDIRKHQ
jgi:phage antirepressor YoqD-like protein